jgi:hypothetical protein
VVAEAWLVGLAVLSLLAFGPAAAQAAIDEQIIVGYEPGVPRAERAQIRAAADVTMLQSSPMADEQLVALDDDADSRRDALEALRDQEGVAFAAPNRPVHPASLPDDPGFADQWYLHNPGGRAWASNGFVDTIMSVADADIDAEEGWAIEPGTPGVLVGVADTGLATNLSDLPADARWSNPGETPGNGVDDDGNGFVDDVLGWDFAYNDAVPEEVHGHGTMVTSIIAARRANALGIAGLAPARIVPAKIFSNTGVGTSWRTSQGMRYLARQGVRVVNLSVGVPLAEADPAISAVAADYPDTLFVFASGNDGAHADRTSGSTGASAQCKTPGANVLCVGASSADDSRSYFSNYGTTSVDLLAPGETIAVLKNSDTPTFATGTSAAAPMVVGVAALLASRAPTATAAQLARAILDGGDPTAGAQGTTVTGRRLNARGALQALGAGPINTTAPQIAGAAAVDAPMTVTPGSWTGASEYRYQWLRCHPTVERCWAIDGARASAYTPTLADRGFRLRASVVGAGTSTGTQAYSQTTGQVSDALPAPSMIEPAAITGTAVVTETLTATWAQWRDAASVTRQWRRCDQALTSCTTVQSDGASYTLTAADIDGRLRLRETATNQTGSTTITSAATDMIGGITGQFTAPPTLTGTTDGHAEVGQQLGVTGWQFSGIPVLSTDVQWFSCPTAEPCAGDRAPVATSAQYTTTSTDRGRYVQARVVITQPGAITRTSTLAGLEHPVGAAAPTLGEPQIDGTAEIGETLRAHATVDAVPDAVVTVQWELCDQEPEPSCGPRPDSTSEQITVTALDARMRLRAVVTATNAYGTVQRRSALTQPIVLRPIVHSVTVNGNAVVDSTMTAATAVSPEGGSARITWVRCRTAALETCEQPAARHGSSTVLTLADQGAYLRAIAVGTYGEVDSTPLTSAAVGPIAANPPTGTDPTRDPDPPGHRQPLVPVQDPAAPQAARPSAPPGPSLALMPARRPAPVSARVRVARSVRLREARLPVTCLVASGCRAAVELRAGGRLLARGAIDAPAGSASVALRLTRAGARMLGRVRLLVQVRITAGGTTSVHTVTVRR